MKFDENGFPYPSGATDKMDSAHAAGLMAFVGHEKMNSSLLLEYVNTQDGRAVRCPYDHSGLDPANPNNFTRDQLLCLLSGYKTYNLDLVARDLYEQAKERGWRAQNIEKDVPGSTKKFPDGADILDPSHIGYMKLCAGMEATWFERLFMRLKIRYAGLFSPMSEPNNIIVMSIIYGYADLLKKTNPQIYQAIKNYWCENEGAWRGEPELAEMLIKKLEEA